MRILPLLLIVLAVLCSRAQEPATHTFGDSVGLNVKYGQGEPQKDLPLLTELGVRWVRDMVSWPELEPVAGQYAEFPAKFQERLKFYKENNIGLLFILAYENNKAYPDSKEKPANSIDADAFGKYAAHAAKLLKASGVKFVLEIWNEPHNFTIKKKLGGEWNAKAPSPWVDHYIAMVHAAVKQVKALDPNVKLIDCDDMWIIHYWFLEKGLPKELDGFGFHPYAGASPGPEVTPVGQETGWAKPFTLTDADRSFQSAVRRLREQSVVKLGKVPALWATEWGWTLGEKAPFSMLTPDGKVTEETLSAYLPRAYITAFASGVEELFWFSSYDSVDGPMGLRANGGKKRKMFDAFKTMTQELGTCMEVYQLFGSDHLSSGVQAFQFKGPGGSKLVMWNIDGTSDYLMDTDLNSKVTIKTNLGASVTPVFQAGGRLELNLSQAPLYITIVPEKLNLTPKPPAVSTQPVLLFP